MTSLSVIILTKNEELNIHQAIASVRDWAEEVLVLDSFSVDRTVGIAEALGAHVYTNQFVDFASQRNYALFALPIKTEWVLFLDADEWVPPALKEEITRTIAEKPFQNGFFLCRRFIWMGRWIRRGYYPTWILRLFRFGKGRCEDRAVNEHLIVDGEVGRLKNDFVHEDHRGIADWVEKHNRYAEREALEMFERQNDGEIDASLTGSQPSRTRWVRLKIWNRLPLLVRPFFYFAYRYFLQGGILEGRSAFIFHFLHALWYPMLIDVRYLELLQKNRRGPKST